MGRKAAPDHISAEARARLEALGDDWISREELGEITGRTYDGVRWLVRRHEITGTRSAGDNRMVLYRASDVLKAFQQSGGARAGASGRLEARLLLSFRRGATPLDAAIEHEVPLESAQRVHRAFQQAARERPDGITLSRDDIRGLEARFRQRFATADDVTSELYELLEALGPADR